MSQSQLAALAKKHSLAVSESTGQVLITLDQLDAYFAERLESAEGKNVGWVTYDGTVCWNNGCPPDGTDLYALPKEL